MSFLRRFDIEHTFRLLKQTLGWTAPRLRDPAADRWTWIAIAAHTQLRRHDLAPDDHPAPETASAPPSTTSAESSRQARPTPDPPTTRKAPNRAGKVKRQV